MKSKVFKVSVILLIILTMTMTNFIFVGNGLISYAINDINTNNNNVKFDSYFKNEKGENVYNLDIDSSKAETSLYLYLNVINQGYLNSEIDLGDTNFIVKGSDSEYVNTIKDNVVKLNQINAGTEAEIELKVEFNKKEEMNTNLLNKESKVILKGTYKDSSEKNKDIKATKNVTLKLISTTTPANIMNDFKIITNKILKINGENKKVVQVSLKTGLKDNSYPIKNIVSEISVPKVEEKVETIKNNIKLNNMTKWELEGNEELVKVNMENERGLWKTLGNEEIILTYIYNENVNLDEAEITANTKIQLYDETTIDAITSKIKINNEEQDAVISAGIVNSESSIYKGKIKEGIDRETKHTTKIDVNLASAIEKIEVNEMPSKYDNTVDANTYYRQTLINKEDLNKVLGEKGSLNILDQNGNILKEINKDTQANDGNIIVSYEENTVKQIKIQILTPEKEGVINLESTRVIKKSDKQTVNTATNITTSYTYKYNDIETAKEEVSKIELKETTTSAEISINKNSFSTLVKNNVEIKAILNSSSEENDLYKNPTITIELPKEVEQININDNDIKLMYEDELKIKNYSVNKNVITINLEGQQTKYKESTVKGANIIINAELILNKKAPSTEAQVIIRYQNQNASRYINDAQIGEEKLTIKVEAPTDVTVVNTIKELSVEEIGENKTKEVRLARGQIAQEIEPQIEIINNKDHSIKNVKVLGKFPTKNSENNIDTKITKGIQLENAQVYYTENENATNDLNNNENKWVKTLENMNNAKKYLIVIDEIASKENLIANYKTQIPENLEYNKQATVGYEITYTDSVTNVESKIVATNIKLTTGRGAIIDAELKATVGNSTVNNQDKVVAGEVIKYVLEVSNSGTEDISKPIEVISEIPEGTKYVEPKENYEYTGTSYYKELDNKEFKAQIKDLKAGEKTTLEYEVRVNSDIANNQIITNSYKTTYDGVTKVSNELKLNTVSGNIRLSVKRITDRNIKLYYDGAVKYFAIIENTTNETQKDVKVKTHLSENIEVTELKLITGLKDLDISNDKLIRDPSESEIDKEDSEFSNENQNELQDVENDEVLEYKDEINIGDLEPGETKVLCYDIYIKKDAKDNISFYVEAEQNNELYRSNVWNDKLINIDVRMNMTSNVTDKYVKSGDILEYLITLENNVDNKVEGLTIEDSIPETLTIESISLNEKELELPDSNELRIETDIEPSSKSTLKISTIVDYSEAREEAEEIANSATATLVSSEVASTPKITHIIEADAVSSDEENSDGNTNVDNNGNNNGNSEENSSGTNDNNENNNVANGNKLISGIAWIDENNNGKKDGNEKGLAGVKVNLLNVKTNKLIKDTKGNNLEVTTNENGSYILNNIVNGKYIVIFDYADKSYSTTKYKVEGALENENSDAIKNKLTIDGESKEVFATDTIEINNNNISNINIGLIKLKNFDLELNKYISKITVSNSKGTTIKEFDDQTLAKIEIDSKTLENSTVVIEYTIRVYNVGEIDGYVKQVADYIPSDLKFNSELNKDWYQSGTSLYNTSLANEKIKPGEFRDLKLTLMKTMTLNNIGLVNNTAEITQYYNELNIEDSNSTPGNKTQNENDMGLADTIIAIKTGGEIIYLSIALIALVIAIGVILTPTIKNKYANSKRHKFDKI